MEAYGGWLIPVSLTVFVCEVAVETTSEAEDAGSPSDEDCDDEVTSGLTALEG